MVRRATLRASLLALAVAGLALAAPSVAGAQPSCGATVKHNVKLTNDLHCTSSDGLIVGKSGITINLAGHSITGPGPSCCNYGIYNEYHRNVTVENGTVKGFYEDFLNYYTSGNKILSIRARNAPYDAAIDMEYAENALIKDTSAAGSYYGMYFYENTRVKVTDSKASHNLDYGVYDDYESLATLDNVTANANGSEGFYVDDPVVAPSANGVAYYTIENSTANNNSGSGFDIEGNTPQWEYQANLIGNTANDNVDYGFYAEYWAKGKRNHAAGNGTKNCYQVPGCS